MDTELWPSLALFNNNKKKSSYSTVFLFVGCIEGSFPLVFTFNLTRYYT
jgi:hypothetical protein